MPPRAYLALFILLLAACDRVPYEPSPAAAPAQTREMRFNDLTHDEQTAVNMACFKHKMNGQVTQFQDCMRTETRKATGGRQVPLDYRPSRGY